ncbi:glycosyltransferase family 4 protein [Photobacterium rosenbergii]|nr:glycosyltransferase family 4 protein [Photobacterium rosenbergii]
MKKSGLTKIIYNVAINIVKDSKVSIVELNSDKHDSEYKASLKSLGVDFYDANVSKVNLLKNIKDISNILSSTSPDVVHAHCLRSIVFLSFVKGNTYKKVCTMHSYIVNNYVGEFGKIKGTLLAKFVINRVKVFDEIISVSESVQKLFKDRENLSTYAICNGVDKKAKAITEYNTIKPIPFIYTGSISHRKRIKFLCESIISYNNFSSTKINLTLAGSGPLFNEISQKYLEHQNLFFLGNVEDVDKYLSEGAYFISASASEGLPNAVMEAMALGLPVILSDIPPHQELLDGDRIGYSFELDSYDSLCKTLNKVVELEESEYLSLASKAHFKINEKFNVEVMANKHKELYEQIIIK